MDQPSVPESLASSDGPSPDLHLAARTLGGWCWAEQRCFEILGGWVRDTANLGAKRLLAVHSRHHAWRAQRLAEVLPRAYVAPVAELVAPRSDPDRAVFEALGSTTTDGMRLAGQYHLVYPALLQAYQRSPIVMSPLSDAPAIRAIRIIVSDGQHDLAEGHALISELGGGTSDPDHLIQLRHLLEKVQVSDHEEGHVATVFHRWGS